MNLVLKVLKFFMCIILFSSVKGFSQDLIIENTTICFTTGSTASISVNVSELSPTYVWYYKTATSWITINSSTPGTVYSNYNTATLKITKSSISPVSGTSYKVIVTSGSTILESNEAVLTVNPIPVIKTITGASAVCEGEEKTLTYGAGSVGDIQWQSSLTSATANDFIDIDGEIGEVYVAPSLQESTWYRVKNTSGVCDPKYSLAVSVVVNTQPVAGYIYGGDVSVCKTSNITDLTLIDYEGTIQWYKAANVGGSPGTFGSISLATRDTYTATNLIASTYFKAIVSNGVCLKEETDPVLITIDPIPIIKSITGATAVCAGEDKTLTYGVGSVGDIQWQFSTTSATADDFIDIDGEIGEVYVAPSLEESTWYRVKNTSGICDPKYSLAVLVEVNTQPVAGYISGGDISVCKTLNTTDLTLNDYAGTIQWQKASSVGGSPGTFANILLATTETYTATNLIASTYFKAIVFNGVCLKEETDPVLITVDAVPVTKIITGASAVCAGGDKTLTYGTGSVGDIQWQFSTTSATADDFVDIDGETGEIYEATNLQESTWYRVKNTSGVCDSKYSLAVFVEVNTQPLAGYISGGDISVCKTLNTTDLTLNDYAGTIQWQKASSVGGSPGTFANISLATKDTYTATGLIASTYFKAIVSNGVCLIEETDPVLITVDAVPVTKTITGASAVCAGGNKTLTYGAGSVGDIQWQFSTTSATATDFIDIDGQTGLVYSANDLQQSTWYRVINTSGMCGSVYSAAVQVVVNSNTTPTFTQVVSICSGSTLAPLPTKSLNAISGSWLPVVNNTKTTTYNFTPIAGVCANMTSMTITVNTTEAPIGNPIQDFNMDIPKSIKDLVASGSSLSWYISQGNALSNTFPLALSTILVKGNTYYAMQTTNGCRSIAPLGVLVNANLGTTLFDFKELQFYPNPVEDYFTVIYPEIISDIQLFNSRGQSVFIARPNSFKTMQNINYLPTGIYFMEVQSNNKKAVLRIIKK